MKDVWRFFVLLSTCESAGCFIIKKLKKKKSRKEKKKKSWPVFPPPAGTSAPPLGQSQTRTQAGLPPLPPSLTTSSETNDSWRIPHRQSRLWPSHAVMLLPQALAKSFLRKLRAWCSPRVRVQPRPAQRRHSLRCCFWGNGVPRSLLGCLQQEPSSRACLGMAPLYSTDEDMGVKFG